MIDVVVVLIFMAINEHQVVASKNCKNDKCVEAILKDAEKSWAVERVQVYDKKDYSPGKFNKNVFEPIKEYWYQ